MRMSKKFLAGALRSEDLKRLHFARFMPIVLSLLAVFFVLLGLASSAQRAPQQSAATTSAARNAALIAATADVLKETSEIRQLSILRPVQSSAQSRAEIERTLIKNLDEEMTAAQAHASEVALRKLGFAPADFQFLARMVWLLLEKAPGVFQPQTQPVHLAG